MYMDILSWLVPIILVILAAMYRRWYREGIRRGNPLAVAVLIGVVGFLVYLFITMSGGRENAIELAKNSYGRSMKQFFSNPENTEIASPIGWKAKHIRGDTYLAYLVIQSRDMSLYEKSKFAWYFEVNTDVETVIPIIDLDIAQSYGLSTVHRERKGFTLAEVKFGNCCLSLALP